jgi:tetratricopeptide (TPR) repeat protein
VNRGVLRAGSSGFVLAGKHRPIIPDDVHSIWVQRLERLLEESINPLARYPSPSDQRLQSQIALELAAALGGRVDTDEWLSVSSLGGVSDPMRVLESLLASRLARADDQGWTFSHNMLSESVERIAREQHRWPSHNRLCAEMLMERRPVPHWGDPERIGRYRFEAEQYEAAVGPLLKGARERMRVEEYAAALELLDLRERAIDQLALSEGHQSRLENILLRAEVKCTRRELGEAERLATQALRLAHSESAKRVEGAALFLLARVKQQDGVFTTAIDYFTQAEALMRAAGPTHELGACLSDKASALLDMGILDAAWDAFNEAQVIFEETGRLLPWAQNQLGLARVALRQGDLDHAMVLCRRVHSFGQREQLNLIEANASMVLAEIHMAEGANEEAREELDASIELFEQLGMVRQALHPRLLGILMLVESASVEQAKAELARLWSGPQLDAPWIATLLMSCLGLALDIDEAPADFNSAVAEVSELIGETEVLPLEIVRCLQLAIERAREMGYPERASQIRRLGTAATHELGTGDEDVLSV